MGPGSANRTVGGDDPLLILISVDGFDFRPDFIDDRRGMLEEDLEQMLESLLSEDRIEVGVVMSLDMVEKLFMC
jgi:hypothetical protein